MAFLKCASGKNGRYFKVQPQAVAKIEFNKKSQKSIVTLRPDHGCVVFEKGIDVGNIQPGSKLEVDYTMEHTARKLGLYRR